MVDWRRKQRGEIARSIAELAGNEYGRERLQRVLDGTVGDALCYTRAALRQFERRGPVFDGFGSDEGQHHAEMHTLLVLAHEAVCHSAQVSRLLRILDHDDDLPPNAATRERLRVARNLLAEHRDERALYWRLTNTHTEHVKQQYEALGVALPDTTIDVELFEGQSELGQRWGTVGGLLSLPDLHHELRLLEAQLEGVRLRLRPPEVPEDEAPGSTITVKFRIVGPISIATS